MASYDWGGGLGSGASGAASGATIGSMLGPGGTLVGGIIGGGLGLLSGFTNKSQAQTQQVNPFAERYWDIASGNMNNYQAMQQKALGEQGFLTDRGISAYQDLATFRPQTQSDPRAYMRALISQEPRLQQLAKTSMGEYGQSAEQTESMLSRAAQTQAAQFNQLGGLGSGAAARAIGQGVADAAYQANLQNQQMYNQSYLNLLAQAGQGIEGGLNRQLQAGMQADQLRFQGLSGRAGGFMQAAGLYGSMAGQYGQQASNFANALGGMARPEFVHTPAQEQPIFGSLVSGLTDAASILSLGRGAGMFGGNSAPTFDYTTPNPLSGRNINYGLSYIH